MVGGCVLCKYLQHIFQVFYFNKSAVGVFTFVNVQQLLAGEFCTFSAMRQALIYGAIVGVATATPHALAVFGGNSAGLAFALKLKFAGIAVNTADRYVHKIHLLTKTE